MLWWPILLHWSLLPANPAARQPFATVQQAIRESGKWAIGHVVFSGKRQTVLVCPEDTVLMLHIMHHPSQRRALAGNDVTDCRVLAKDLRPLLRIINSADGPIPWEDFRDDTDQRLAELVQAKIRPTKRRRTTGANGKPRPKTTRSRSGASRTRRKAA